MWKKILLLVIVLVLAAVAGVTVYVNNIDWNRHKDKISEQFSAATGKEVVFNGAVSFNLFPSPSLAASDIDIYNRNTAGERVLVAKIKQLVSTLSVSSLLNGNFNVERMSLIEPEIFVESYSDGKLNWQSSASGQQNFQVDNVEISLSSLTIEKAKMHLISQDYDIHTTLDNMNAEVIAQSLFGPYRIEGSYTRDNNPGGFAISLGQFSDSFATSVNAVISHPQSESYVRFDGTVLLNNDAINGNLIIESQNPVNYFNANFKDVKVSEKYEHPLAVSIELKTDKTQISLANIVLKYGQSAGAGNILIPRNEQKIGENGMERRRIDAVFNMTEFELEPAVQVVEDFITKYDRKENYMPEFDFDVIADLKALKTTYNGQVIRDFDLSVDFMNNVFKVQNFAATLPGETAIKLNGEIFAVEKKLTYNFIANSSSQDFSKLAKWLKLNIEPLTAGTYKKASLSATIEGTTDMIKISPFDFMIDRTSVNGKIGIVRADKTRWFVIADADSINLDNYVPGLPKDIVAKSWEDRLLYRFGKLSFLKDADIQFRTSLKSGIWEKIPFENFDMEATIRDGIMKIADLAVKSVATADFAFKGELSGFGDKPQVKNLRYQADISDMVSFLNKFGIVISGIDFSALNRFTSSGVVTGGMERAAVKANSSLGDIENAYRGEIYRRNGAYGLNGTTEVKAPDFVKMVNSLGADYAPNYPLGLFRLNADVKSSAKVIVLKNMSANIGANTFAGDVAYQNKDGRNQIKTKLKINRFEFEKFFYNSNQKDDKTNFRNSGETATFLVKPRLSQVRINYGWLKNIDANINFEADVLSMDSTVFNRTSGNLTLNKEVLKLAKFVGENNKGVVSGDVELNIPLDAKFSGKLSLKGITIPKNDWSGSIYGLTRGQLNSDIIFDTSATTVENMMSNLSGVINFAIEKPIIKGWDFGKIESDLAKRDVSDGFTAIARDALVQGETIFSSLSGEAKLENGAYKISNARLVNSDMTINFSADGSLKNWTNTASMQVVFNDAKVPGFDFSYDGSISTPILDVDVSRVTQVYDSHWAQLEAKAKAEEKARIEKYRALMDEQQDKAHALEKIVNDEISPDFKQYSQLARDEKMRGQYRDIEKNISRVNTLLEEIFVKENMVNADDDVIARLDKQNKEIATLIEKIKSEMKRVHLKDVKLRINKNYNVIFDNYNASKKMSLEHIDRFGNFDKRLAAINTKFYIKNDASIADWQKRIEAGLLAIDHTNSEVAKQNLELQNMSDVKQLEEAFTKFDNARQSTTRELSDMQKAIAELMAYTEDKVSVEEKAYAKRLLDEEIRRKKEENTGQISTSTGKKMTVERDLEDIERGEDAVKNQDVRVLDFSDEDETASGVVVSGKKSSRSNQNSGTGVIRKINNSGEVKSGGIIVKQ